MSHLEHIIALAATAPMGIPPWDVGCVAVRGGEEVQRVAREVIQGYEGFLKIFRPWLLALMRPFVSQAKYGQFAHFVRPLAETYVRGQREGRDLLFYGAPALLLFHHSPYADAPCADDSSVWTCFLHAKKHTPNCRVTFHAACIL